MNKIYNSALYVFIIFLFFCSDYGLKGQLLLKRNSGFVSIKNSSYLVSKVTSENELRQNSVSFSGQNLKIFQLKEKNNFPLKGEVKLRQTENSNPGNIINNFLDNKNKYIYEKSVNNPDNIGKKYPLWIPITELISLHGGVCLFSNHVLHNEFAKISFKSVKQNFKTGFVWDPDYFVTNYFAHPYNGSIYYNIGRANGYNYAASSVFTFAGSLTWELFMETEPPAINDIYNTTLSGIFLGEATHRLSSLLIDERATGFERVLREVGIGFIDIARGFNRLFQGKSWEVNSNKYNRKPLALNVYYGVNWNNYGTKIGTGIANGVAGFGLLYGQPFATKKREIMDFFKMTGNFNFGAGQPKVGSLEGTGLLYGKSYKSSEKSDNLLGIFHQYDYLENKAYQIGAITFSAGFLKRTVTSGKSHLMYSVNLGVMPLGGSKSVYIDTVERTYSFSGGLNTKLEIYYTGNWGLLYAGYNFYWYNTYVGAKGNEFYGILRPKVVINITKNIGIGAQFFLGHKSGYYSDVPDIHGRTYQGMLLLQYKIGDIAF